MPQDATLLTAPQPPRYRWLKRLSVLALLLVLATVGLWFFAIHRAQARLDKRIADIHRRGEPILFEDLTYPIVFDEDNKAYYLRRVLNEWPSAGSSGKKITDTLWYEEDGLDPDTEIPTPDPISNNAQYLTNCSVIRNLLHQAASASNTDWGQRFTQYNAYNHLLPHLRESRELARLCQDASERCVQSGDLSQAFEWIWLTGEISQAQHGTFPSIICHLVSLSIQALAMGTLEDQVLTQTRPQAWQSPGVQTQAKRLIEQLLDEPRWQQHLQSAWIGERFMQYDACEAFVIGKMSWNNMASNASSTLQRAKQIPQKPFILADTELLIGITSEMANASEFNNNRSDYYKELKAHGVDIHQIETELEENYARYPVTSIMLPALDSAMTSHFKSAASRRMAATAIAIRLYEADYGHHPENLDQLVPKYLDAIPIDPFDPDGKPIRYLPSSSQLHWDEDALEYADDLAIATPPLPLGPPILYSVGADGINDGGHVHISREGKIRSSNKFNSPDYWFPLDNWPRITPLPDIEGDDFEMEMLKMDFFSP